MTGALARKINRAKWQARDGLRPGEPSADVLGDLKTAGHKLSVWQCGPDEAHPGRVALKSVVLAIAAGMDRIDKVDLAWIGEEEL